MADFSSGAPTMMGSLSQPAQDARSQLLVPIMAIEGLGELTHGIPEFSSLKQVSSRIQIPEYRKELEELSKTLDRTSQAYEDAVKKVEEESKIGMIVARDAADLVDQLLKPGKRPDEIKRLLGNLVSKMGDLISAAAQLKEGFLVVRTTLLGSKGVAVKLTEYGDAAVPLVRKLLAAAYNFAAFVVPPLSNKAKEFSATANRGIRSVAAKKVSNILEEMERRLDHAIEVVSTHINEWSLCHDVIGDTSSNDLLATDEYILEMCGRRWREIEQQFKKCACEASFAWQQLENTHGDAHHDTRRRQERVMNNSSNIAGAR